MSAAGVQTDQPLQASLKATSQRVPATYEDLCQLPDRVVGELIDGVLHASPRPASRHAFAASELGAVLTTTFGPWGRKGGWILLDEPELRLGDDTLVPDIAGWRVARMPAVPDVAAIEIPPDWVCEVLSPGTSRLDRRHKRPVYAAHGVGHLWFLDPIERSLEVFALRDANWVLLSVFADDERVQAEPFEDFEIDLSHLWAMGAEARGKA